MMNIIRRNNATHEALKIALPIVILLAGAGGVVLVMALKREPASTAVSKAEATVTTVAIEPHDQGIDIQVDGMVVPFREVDLSAEVAGRVKTVTPLCRAGKFVRKGQLLVEIDPADYALEVERLNRELDQAKAAIEETQVELGSNRQLVPLVKEEADLQQKQVERLQKLGSGVSTETAIDQARRSSLMAQNALIQLEQKVLMIEKKQLRLEHARDLVKAQLDRAQLDLDRCRITAPVDGMVVSESVEQDSFVQKGTSLVTVEDTSSIEVKCNLMMDHLNWLWRQQRNRPTGAGFNSGGFGPDAPATRPVSRSSDPGGFDRGEFDRGGFDRGGFDRGGFDRPSENGIVVQGPDEGGFDVSSRDYQLPQAEVTVLWDLGGRQFAWRGRLDRYDGIGVNQQTRTVPCRAVVERPSNVLEVQDGDPHKLAPAVGGPPALVRGMYVRLRIHCQPSTPLVRLPERAIRPGKTVWLLRDGKLVFEQVHVATIDRDVAILDAAGASFKPGDKVVVSALAYAHEGMEVKEESAPPATEPKSQCRAEVASDPSRSKS
ncbi:MAG: HlyD family efflux transporter periplasmic adaptor subunit [Pirellulaceae bacterium]